MAETQDQTVSKTHNEAADEAFSVGFPLPESNTSASETRTNPSSNWRSKQESNCMTDQGPATRSNFPSTGIRQRLDKLQKSKVFSGYQAASVHPRSHSATRKWGYDWGKPAAKQDKLANRAGLYLLMTPAGGKLWRLKYPLGWQG